VSSYTDRDAALAVSCAQCQAEPGDPCCSDDATRLEPVHASRITDLAELIHRALGEYDREGLNP
jgi:hypothetical protein